MTDFEFWRERTISTLFNNIVSLVELGVHNYW